MVLPSGDHPNAIGFELCDHHHCETGIPFGEGKSIAFPVVASQMAYFAPAAVTSRATILVPSGDQAGLAYGLLCVACSAPSIWPVEGFQRCSPPTESPTARRVPSGDQATLTGQKEGSELMRRTLCCCQREKSFTANAFQMLTRPPLQAMARCWLLGDQANDQAPAGEVGESSVASSWPSLARQMVTWLPEPPAAKALL